MGVGSTDHRATALAATCRDAALAVGAGERGARVRHLRRVRSRRILVRSANLACPAFIAQTARWRDWVWLPLVIGVVVGIAMVIGDRALAIIGNWRGFAHPPFPLSILASGSAGIGEEIMFRMFVLGLWAFLLNLILRRWHATNVALWIANVIAALAFAAGHIPAAMMLVGVTTPDALPPVVLVELFLLNGIVAIVAGERYIRDGLVAAAGVHFWADVVWHVIFPLVAV